MSTTTSTAPPQRALTSEDAASSTQIAVPSGAARRLLAVLRIATGAMFLCPFFDKSFGLGFSTTTDMAWINGGSPTQGFLGNLDPAKPFSGVLSAIASPVTDWLFMIGMLGVGLALILGIGTRVAGAAGALLMGMLYLAVLPAVSGQEPSTNPVVDQHIILALVAIIVPLTRAGDTWGLGRWWRSLPLVKRNPWLI
ncbi:MAG: DoxX family protein [Acidipropionibacterium acidipropionici]|jgi:thiosulfate dehydrogenase [quinone] large subunit|uniref:DoxX family protein n=1 Tax=Acidipropionibacterium acidipropionici TaxID=1748 RepID=UPI002F356E37